MEYLELAKKMLGGRLGEINAYNRVDYLIMVISYLKNQGMTDINLIKDELAQFLAEPYGKKEVLASAYRFDIEKADQLTFKEEVKPVEKDSEGMEYDEDFLQELGMEINK